MPPTPAKVTVPGLLAMRARGERVVCVTAYDATFGAIADEAGVDVILVGDSLGNVILGYETTLPVNLEDMVSHTRGTRTGVKRALLVADLPFGSYQMGGAEAMKSAVALMKAGAEAVKIEGPYPELVREFTRAGIPTMGHIGMTPQSVNQFGGFKAQGRGEQAEMVLAQAKELDAAGAFGLVLELIPPDLARRITQSVSCHAIGIGAGLECTGQIQVLHDLLGLSPYKFRHARAFLDGRKLVAEALGEYAASVRSGEFPGAENTV